MSYQPLGFGKSLPSSGTDFLKVKEKGDKVQFRIAQEPVYTGKHFVQTETGWDVPECPRINSQEECERCDRFFTLKAQAKKLKETNKKESDRLENEARNFAPTTQFYFPVLNRITEEFGILQVTSGVRNQLNTHFEAGVDVMSKEWILKNTGLTGKERYSVTMVDSADVKPFTRKEEEEWAKANGYDLTQIAGGNGEDE